MQQIFSNSLIRTHCKGELPFWPGKTASPLDNPMPEGVESFKRPSRWALGKRSWSRRTGAHLYLTRHVVSHHGAKGKDLVRDQSLAGNHAETGIGFGISKDVFLAAAAIVKQDYAFGRFCLVRHNHFIVEAEIARFE